jgi:hypothetical protein
MELDPSIQVVMHSVLSLKIRSDRIARKILACKRVLRKIKYAVGEVN